jgi:predicted PurR-regulated permease PerM
MEATDRVERPQLSVKTVLIASLTILLVVAGAAFILETRLALMLTIASALIAAALHHGVDFLTRRRLSRGWALTLTLSAFALALVGVFMMLVPPAVNQGSKLAEQAPQLIDHAKQTPLYQQLERRFGVTEVVRSESQQTIRQSATPALKVVGGILGFAGEILSMLFLVIFMLIFGRDLVRALLQEALPERRVRYAAVAEKVYRAVGGYIAGLGFICSVNATMATIFLAIMRVPFFLPLGIASGLSSLVPYGGPVVAGGVITLLTLATKGPVAALITVVYFVCYGQLEGQVLGPLVYRRTVHVNPLVTFLSILFLAELAGVPGAIVAVPAAAAGQIVLRELLAIRRERLGLA